MLLHKVSHLFPSMPSKGPFFLPRNLGVNERRRASNAPPTEVFTLGTSERNVPYYNSQTMDVYLPSAGFTRSLPIAIFVHGGGLSIRNKVEINMIFLYELASAGYAVVSVSYHLAPQISLLDSSSDLRDQRAQC